MFRSITLKYCSYFSKYRGFKSIYVLLTIYLVLSLFLIKYRSWQMIWYNKKKRIKQNVQNPSWWTSESWRLREDSCWFKGSRHLTWNICLYVWSHKLNRNLLEYDYIGITRLNCEITNLANKGTICYHFV